MKYYWETIADKLSKAGRSWGCVSAGTPSPSGGGGPGLGFLGVRNPRAHVRVHAATNLVSTFNAGARKAAKEMLEAIFRESHQCLTFIGPQFVSRTRVLSSELSGLPDTWKSEALTLLTAETCWELLLRILWMLWPTFRKSSSISSLPN